MPNAAWIEAVERWRKLPNEEKQRRRLEAKRWLGFPGHISGESKVLCCDLVPTQSSRQGPCQDEHANP